MIDDSGLVPSGPDGSFLMRKAQRYIDEQTLLPQKTLDIKIDAIPNQLMEDHSTLRDSVPQQK